MQDLRPRRVLEVGIGHGKYGVLVREYLELPYERYTKSEWQLELIGIEVFAKYRNPLWDYAYNQVLVEDVRNVDLERLGRFDCCLLLDVVEHFDHDEGRFLLERLLNLCKCVIVSTPLKFEEQGAQFDNEHERHWSLWRRKDYRPYYFTYRKCGNCSVVVLSRNPLNPVLGQDSSGYLKLRQYLLKRLPGPAIKSICLVKSIGRGILSALPGATKKTAL
ncbi:MAG: hypothetical protein HY236_13305 [Acidobacteria bacterium]|nr:hypothetical protein [Acidobacteriota bacterium]